MWDGRGHRHDAASQQAAPVPGVLQVPDVGDFMRQHSMQCPMALQRLVVVGLPATVEHGGGRSATSNSSAAVVAEITAAFITCLDSVRLNMLAVDQVLTRLPGR